MWQDDLTGKALNLIRYDDWWVEFAILSPKRGNDLGAIKKYTSL